MYLPISSFLAFFLSFLIHSSESVSIASSSSTHSPYSPTNSSYSNTPTTFNDEVLGLLLLKAALVDPTDALRSWSSDDESPCSWTGIECDEDNGRVITLQLHDLSLSGHLGRGLQKLQSLQTLSLSRNNLSGSISAENMGGASRQLRRLDLSYNLLSGPIPSSLAAFTSLKSLDLSNNLLTGRISPQLFNSSGGCMALHYLSFAGNSLDGPIPDTISQCSNLRHLNLSINRLTGIVSVTPLSQLTVLDLSYNSLVGPLPPLDMPALTDVRLQSNRFSGPIPSQSSFSPSLIHLDLSRNLISGALPESLRTLTSLSTLNMAHNSIQGSLPAWLGSLTSLKVLSLAFNLLSGQVPSTVGLLKDLMMMDLSHNMLYGEIPGSLSGCDELKFIDLSANELNGSLPSMLPPGLLVFNLSKNALTSDGLMYSQCGLLESLDLSDNKLSGKLPSLLPCERMEYFNASYNSFDGEIPAFPQDSAILTIDLSHNELYGEIPRSVGEANSLSTLLLDHNKLNGSIPHQIGNCSSLTNIDLSHNNISGGIPEEMGRLLDLTSLNLSFNLLEGPVPEYGALLRFDGASFMGNTRLCGANVNASCPSMVPKPLVLDPNSTLMGSGVTTPHHNRATPSRDKTTPQKHIMLSISAILAISAAAAISAGVIVILFLNSYSTRLFSHLASSDRSTDFKSMRSTSSYFLANDSNSDNANGKLVMFSMKTSDPRSEDWVRSALALLNKDSELGSGGSGAIYKAVLGDGRTVVIKKLAISSQVKSQHEFEKEIQFLGQIKHKNLLPLQGYYWTPELQLLIYDFIPNGNLSKRLHEDSVDSPMTWSTRFKIALGVARGLAHLHHRCDPNVIHFNVKSTNVLLDERYNPKLADCGLANLLPVQDRYMMSIKSQYAAVHMAPEFSSDENSMTIGNKCDVYGYGVMLLELVTGRRPVEYIGDDAVVLCDYVRSLVEGSKPMLCVDSRLPRDEYTEGEMLPVIKLGLICCSQAAKSRPTMVEVVQILELIKA